MNEVAQMSILIDKVFFDLTVTSGKFFLPSVMGQFTASGSQLTTYNQRPTSLKTWIYQNPKLITQKEI